MKRIPPLSAAPGSDCPRRLPESAPRFHGIVLCLAAVVLASTCMPVHGADVGLFAVLKSQQFQQTNAGAPVALATGGFAFNALVLASTNNVVTNATVDPSNATPLRQLTSDASQALWRFEERFDSQAALDGVYPNGTIFSPINYAMAMHTVHDGLRTVNLNFSSFTLLGTPPTPVLSNASWTAAQAIDTAAPFTLRWAPPGGVADLIQVIVNDAASNVVFASPAPLSAGALTGASNSLTIPSYSLPAASSLIGHLAFLRPGLPETNSYAGAVGVPALVKDTEFPMITRPAPIRPVLEVLTSNPPPFRLRFTGESNRIYRIQASVDMQAWGDIHVTNSPTGTGSFTDPGSGLLDERFYRIQVGP